MFSEDDLLPISALQHLAFCERQWALIHLEGVWTENRLTIEGRHLHECAHAPGHESRPGLRIARALRLRSLRLGLTGVADVVEFHPVAKPRGRSPAPSSLPEESVSPTPDLPARDNAVYIKDADGLWRPFPVEYKRGRPKKNRCDEVQLCAQALCLEEMLDVSVPSGALFYGQTRRRTDVNFDSSLRQFTEALTERLHTLSEGRTTPRAVHGKQCRSCSLIASCLPKVTDGGSSAREYIADAIRQSTSNRETGS